MSSRQQTSELAAVADAIRSHDRFLIVTHENPDGDALGSLLAMKLALDQLGKDSQMYLYGHAPLPSEYGFMALDGLRREPPEDAGERGLAELGVELTPEIAEALYIALVTDTGRFQYTNTTPKALRLAAELVEAGADVHRIFQGVYESVQFAKLKLLARALERAQVYEGGRIVVSYLLRTDFADVGAAEPYSEGIIDYLRAVEGADMAVLIREPPREDGPTRRVSLRASVDELDVSAIARKSGGGGHRQAAGFSSEASIEEISDFVRREFASAYSG